MNAPANKRPRGSWLQRLAFWRRWRSSPSSPSSKRIKLEDLSARGYDTAKGDRRYQWFRGDSNDANTELERSLPILRNQSRELVRNDAHAASAVSVIVSNVVGEGIQPRSSASAGGMALPEDPARGWPAETLDERADRLWRWWAEDADSTGQLDAYGQQILACRGVIESGEALLRRRWRRATDDLLVPVQIELLEGDLLDTGRTERRNGAAIVQGVEFGVLGQRRAYWLFGSHPGSQIGSLNLTRSSSSSRRVPASEVSHVYEPLRPGQVRGVPALTPVMGRLRQFSDYSDAELERKRLEACMFASIHGDELEPEDGAIGDRVTDSSGFAVETLEPGLILYPPPGADVTLHAPASIGGVAEYRRQELTAIASGVRLVYTLLTGDLSGVNFSSIRAGLIEFRRFVRAFRTQVFVRGVCRTQWRWFIEAAITAGLLPEFDGAGSPIVYRASWTPPIFESVDRKKDAEADALELGARTSDLGEIIRGRGKVPEEVLADEAKYEAMLAELGLSASWQIGSSSGSSDGSPDDESDGEAAEE